METTINQRLKKLRQHLGKNQEEFAKVLNVGQANISAMELKSSIMPYHIETLHQKFNVSKLWLIDGKGEMFESAEAKPELPAANWKEEAYTAIKSERDLLKSELNRVWGIVQHLTGGKAPDFRKAIENTGLFAYRFPNKQTNNSSIARA